MSVKIHRWTWLRREPCVTCGLPTSRWLKIRLREGGVICGPCLMKELS